MPPASPPPPRYGGDRAAATGEDGARRGEEALRACAGRAADWALRQGTEEKEKRKKERKRDEGKEDERRRREARRVLKEAGGIPREGAAVVCGALRHQQVGRRKGWSGAAAAAGACGERSAMAADKARGALPGPAAGLPQGSGCGWRAAAACGAARPCMAVGGGAGGRRGCAVCAVRAVSVCAEAGPRGGDSSAEEGKRRGRREGEGEPDFMVLKRCHDLISLCLHSSDQALLWTVRMEGSCWGFSGNILCTPEVAEQRSVRAAGSPGLLRGSVPGAGGGKKQRRHSGRQSPSIYVVLLHEMCPGAFAGRISGRRGAPISGIKDNNKRCGRCAICLFKHNPKQPSPKDGRHVLGAMPVLSRY